MQNRIGLAVIIKNEIDLLNEFVAKNDIINLFAEIKFLDGFSGDGTYEKLKEYDKQGWCKIYQRDLNFNFSEQRNYLNSLMKSEYIMRLDIDEYMNKNLMKFIENFKDEKDLYIINRQELIDDESLEFVPTSIFYRNNEIIHWENRIHETLKGFEEKELLSNEYLIIHNKTGKRQNKQNKFYWDNWKEQRGLVKNEPK